MELKKAKVIYIIVVDVFEQNRTAQPKINEIKKKMKTKTNNNLTVEE